MELIRAGSFLGDNISYFFLSLITTNTATARTTTAMMM